MHTFDREYWESHWQKVPTTSTGREVSEHPYLTREVAGLAPGTAMEAGCGEGAEAVWLAARGWQVTAADISTEALTRAADRAAARGLDANRIRWVEADLSVWQPDARSDLVTTFYAHPAIPQLAFYDRIAEWVAPGGTLLIVGHDHGAHDHHHGGHDNHDGDRHPPEKATATVSSITALLDDATWDVVTAEQNLRTLANGSGGTVELHDVVVSATRRR